MFNKLEHLNIHDIQTQVCELSERNHTNVNCQVEGSFALLSTEQAHHYVSNFQRQQNNPHSNTCNPGWRNNQNLLWNNTQNTLKPPPEFQPQKRSQIWMLLPNLK